MVEINQICLESVSIKVSLAECLVVLYANIACVHRVIVYNMYLVVKIMRSKYV